MPHPIARTYLSLGAFYASDPAAAARASATSACSGARAAAPRSAPRGCATRASSTSSSTPSAGAAAAACTCSRRARTRPSSTPARGLAGRLRPAGSLEWLLSRMGDGAPVPPLPRFRRSRGRVIRLRRPGGRQPPTQRQPAQAWRANAGGILSRGLELPAGPAEVHALVAALRAALAVAVLVARVGERHLRSSWRPSADSCSARWRPRPRSAADEEERPPPRRIVPIGSPMSTRSTWSGR